MTTWELNIPEGKQRDVLFVGSLPFTRMLIQSLNWHHSGFNVYCGSAISPGDKEGLEKLALFIRAPLSQERLCYIPESEVPDGIARVIYRGKNNGVPPHQKYLPLNRCPINMLYQVFFTESRFNSFYPPASVCRSCSSISHPPYIMRITATIVFVSTGR